MAVVLGMSACGGYTVGFMWVLGTQYNQIAGFKIDDFTGNLTDMVGSPYSSGGANPVSITVRTGGNFVFVVNKGTLNSQGKPNYDGNVAVFSVGEDGVLTSQGTYTTAGGTPVWAQADGTGTYLYVLDSQAPDYATTGNGDITVFLVDGTTGRLQIVTNAQQKVNNLNTNYFEVGPAPTMLRASGACVYTLDSGDQTIYPYGLGANGQLTIQVTGPIKTGAKNLTSINAAGSNIYLTDAGTNQILPYSPGSNCNLSAQVAGAVPNLGTAVDPVYSMTDSKNQFLYVLNHGNTIPNSTNANSTISAFNILSTGALQPISDGPNNPYAVGNGPVCMVEDPSNQYLYTSNNNDGSVTGKFINQKTGQLSDLPRGSTFQATGLATCLAVSGNVD